MKVGIIGCGFIANYAHIPSYLNNPEVEAVSVCTPNHVHAQISIDALHAGKNVLCEKPAARTYEEAKTMLDAQRETGKVLNIGVVNRFAESINRIKGYIDSGKLGDVHHVYISFRAHRSIPGLGGTFITKAIAGGGALIDWGVHYLDIVMYCCGDPEVKTVTGETFCKLGKNMEDYVYTRMWAGPPKYDGVYDVDDSVTALIRTTGPVITLNGAWAQNINVDEQYIDFMGDKGGIRYMYGKEFTFYTTEDGTLVEYVPVYNGNDFAANEKEKFQTEIDSFVRCIKTGETLPSHIEIHSKTSELMQAIYDSAEQHKEINLR